MKVLITGARGFVGSHLTKYLMSGDDSYIVGASRKLEFIENLKGNVHQIASYDEIIEGTLSIHHYVHLAGKVIDVHQKGSEKEYQEVNFEQTKRLFDRFVEDDRAEKFIFLSTIHVLTEKPDVILDENYIPEPFTAYGRSKFDAENYIVNHCPPHKKYYILRPSMIHGPGNKGNLNLLFNLVKRGIPYPVGYVNNKRSFVSIENLCFIINEIISNEIEPGLYHIADDEPTYTHDLIHLIAESIGKKAKIININSKILSVAARLGNILPFLPLNELRLNKLTSDFIVSNEKIKKAIGKPLPVKSYDGIKKTIESFAQK
jgi:nucleoside-diphosphate-sugar epimerase